ncbi:hypothetical protein BX661DRAFT_52698 [Kickxella alabastrina]|uniref:uncharacterized protein n=1 Tax=Kickxella alabastrina TaxID=61397 RepID=UPI0022201CBF|nr:uncharacterized protein BX661DRAFT_52698 [Kickxella alabastrina]KAI7823908.1 hypothetical protein BX661DRAFT_52698 [Kickxella alabastrina]
MSGLTPPTETGESKTDGTFQTSTESQTKANLPPEEWETDHVRDKRRQWLLKCLGDNIRDSYLFDDFVESLGVEQRYKRFIKDWPDLFLDIARGSPVADSKGIVANARYAINEFDDFPIADIFKKHSGKLMRLTKEARLAKYFISSSTRWTMQFVSQIELFRQAKLQSQSAGLLRWSIRGMSYKALRTSQLSHFTTVHNTGH